MTEKVKITYLILAGLTQCILLILLTISVLHEHYLLGLLLLLLTFSCSIDITNKVKEWR